MEDEYGKFRAMSDEMYYSLPTHDSIENKMIRDCINELYVHSIPSITLDELEAIYKKNKDEHGKKYADSQHTYQGYYCPHTIQNQIIDHYLQMYNLEENWKDYVDIVLRDLEKGPTIEKYMKDNEDSPGYRGYEHLEPLKNKIGEEAYNQVVDYINKIKDFYRFEYRIQNIRFSIWNVAPNCSLEATIRWRRENGEPDFNITEEEIEKKYFTDEEDVPVYEDEIDENE